MKSTFEFLEGMYLPGYMTLVGVDYEGRQGNFVMSPREPQITLLSSKYLTPRGSHISISQATYALVERLVEEGELDITIEALRAIAHEGRLKMIELNQKFRRELETTAPLEGRFTLTKLRPGKVPVVKMDFDLGNKGFTGDLTALVAPRPMPQMNADVLRPRN